MSSLLAFKLDRLGATLAIIYFLELPVDCDLESKLSRVNLRPAVWSSGLFSTRYFSSCQAHGRQPYHIDNIRLKNIQSRADHGERKKPKPKPRSANANPTTRRAIQVARARDEGSSGQQARAEERQGVSRESEQRGQRAHNSTQRTRQPARYSAQ